MPTYEYVCDACKHRFDELQSFSDAPLKKCPSCKKSKLRRLFGTGAAILFKGSGFYQTDYRSESYKTAAKADAEAPKSTDSGIADKGGNCPLAETAKSAPAKNSPKTEGSKQAPGLLERARLSLLGRLCAVFSSEAHRVTVVFDAAAAPRGVSSEQSFRGLQVRFAVHEEQADDLIEELIKKDATPRQLI